MPVKNKLSLGREYPTHNEESYIGQMRTGVVNQLEKLYAPGSTERQAHPKEHGLVAAEFIVEKDIPDHLKVGFFAEAKTFPAWIRLSNASTKIQADSKKDTRGFAIKVVDVPGENLTYGGTDAHSQDFLMISSPTFLAKTLKEFAALLTAAISGKILAYALNPFHLGTLMRTKKELVAANNVLQMPYWSAVPYQLGKLDQAVKYHVKPVSPKKDGKPKNPTDSYLRERMITDLNEGDVLYDFMIQLQVNPDKMPIEDPTVEWTSPFIKVAQLRIPKQEFDSEKQLTYGQNLSFNPWHSLTAHRPLGSFNRARRIIYPADVSKRLGRDKVTPPVVVPPDLSSTK